MPRDQRLYMTFPIDFWMHPKIAPLSDSAFRTFVEINGYSRMLHLDGRVPVATARKTWKPKALAELAANHPERPSLSIDGDCFVIWNYAEHQLTEADIEDLREKRSQAGRKGGKSTANAKALATANAKQTGSKVQAESESESEIQTDVTYLAESGHVGDGSTSGLDAVNRGVKQRARRARITDLAAVRAALEAAAQQPVSPYGAVILVEAIISKSKRPVDDVDAYVAVVCRKSAPEVQQAYFDLDIEGVAS